MTTVDASAAVRRSEIIVGPKDGDHLPMCIDLVEKQTHHLFTMIDALRVRGIRIHIR